MISAKCLVLEVLGGSHRLKTAVWAMVLKGMVTELEKVLLGPGCSGKPDSPPSAGPGPPGPTVTGD